MKHCKELNKENCNQGEWLNDEKVHDFNKIDQDGVVYCTWCEGKKMKGVSYN